VEGVHRGAAHDGPPRPEGAHEDRLDDVADAQEPYEEARRDEDEDGPPREPDGGERPSGARLRRPGRH
jgi:hypothetical protein